MFTGIITHTGTLESVKSSIFSFKVQKSLLAKIKKGNSICVSGVCLTVTSKGSTSFDVDVMPETLKRTNLGGLKVGDLVNLEQAMSASGLFEGHIVQGHIDGIGRVESIINEGNSRLFKFKTKAGLTKFIVEKGSVGVNGVSLTVIDVGGDNFSVGIIPYTLKNTNFKNLKVGDGVNVEADILAKYVLSGKKGKGL